MKAFTVTLKNIFNQETKVVNVNAANATTAAVKAGASQEWLILAIKDKGNLKCVFQ